VPHSLDLDLRDKIDERENNTATAALAAARRVKIFGC
jgi:hypothetical protein